MIKSSIHKEVFTIFFSSDNAYYYIILYLSEFPRVTLKFKQSLKKSTGAQKATLLYKVDFLYSSNDLELIEIILDCFQEVIWND